MAEKTYGVGGEERDEKEVEEAVQSFLAAVKVIEKHVGMKPRELVALTDWTNVPWSWRPKDATSLNKGEFTWRRGIKTQGPDDYHHHCMNIWRGTKYCVAQSNGHHTEPVAWLLTTADEIQDSEEELDDSD